MKSPAWLLFGCLFSLLLSSAHLTRAFAVLTSDLPMAADAGGDARHFWAVSQMLEASEPIAVYDRQRLADASTSEAFFYPPTALLALAPVAGTSYQDFWRGHILLTLGLYSVAAFLFIRANTPQRRLQLAFLCTALCFGGLTETLFYGQMAGYLAALWLVAYVLYRRFPLSTALPIAVLSLKPHLGVLLSVWLIRQHQWRLLLLTSFAVAALVVLTLVLWGAELWQAYGAVLHEIVGRTHASELLNNPNAPSSLYYGLRRLDVAAPLALVLQLLTGGLAALWLMRQKLDAPTQFAFLPIVTLLLVPHWYPYDLALLVLPLLLMLCALLRAQAHWYDRALWLVCFALPPLSDKLNEVSKIGLWPILLMLLLWRGVALVRSK